MQKKGSYRFIVFRFNPAEDTVPHFATYGLDPHDRFMTVLDALNEIRWHQDGTLAFRRSCRSGICGSCSLNINGKNRLACETMLTSFAQRTITIRPLPFYPIIRDLVVDMSPFFKSIESVHPFLIPTAPTSSFRQESPLLQKPADRAKLEGSYECIHCGACTSACPSFWSHEKYVGPAAALKAYRYCADSRDVATETRLACLDDDDGIWRCHSIFNCTEACPKALDPAAAIQALRAELIRRKIRRIVHRDPR